MIPVRFYWYRNQFIRWLKRFITYCEHCGAWWACPVPSQTQYVWNGEGEDPNRDLILCRMCEAEYTDMMNEKWAEYNSSRL